MRVCDLVKADLDADFRSDVKLSDYDDPALNTSLLEHYIFTVHAPSTRGMEQRTLSAWGVLEQLRDMFVTNRAENRMVLVANYGHGKSHLALVLANFFAKKPDSGEVRVILDKLNHALNNPSLLQGYQDFKQSKGEFLVVRLRGDAFEDLQAAFRAALEQALGEHEATQNVQMPFWQTEAQAWLNGLQGDLRAKADAILAEERTDLAWLTQSLGSQGSYTLVRELFKRLMGVYPDFGGEVNLAKMVKWAVNDVCAPKGLGGLLVLFDEFGLFLQKYAASGTPSKLQDLLNGISDCKGKAAFVAFSQRDVDDIAKTYASGARREDVSKELERLPKDRRHRLYSALESVLAAYLKQDQTAWTNALSVQSVKGALARAREVLLERYKERYENEFKWKPEDVEPNLVRATFPLHPLTTAILATHAFEAGPSESPRTALQFVRRVWEEVRDRPAFTDADKPAPWFVHAVALVDFFGESLSKEWHRAYRQAAESVAQGSNEDLVLKALLLQHAVKELKATGAAQIELLSHLSGVNESAVKGALKDLAQRSLIRYESRDQSYALWPNSVQSQEALALIEQAESAVQIDDELMDLICEKTPKPGLSGLNFGHSDDWHPREVVLTTEMFTAEKLKNYLLLPFKADQGRFSESKRGLLIWVVAEDETKRAELVQNASAILERALQESEAPELPVVVLLPKKATPQVLQAARRLQAIKTLETDARRKLGELFLERQEKEAERRFEQMVRDWVGGLEGDSDLSRALTYLVPEAYEPHVRVLKHQSLNAVLAECYRCAYLERPEFFTEFQVSGRGPNKLRDATHKVAHSLLVNNARAHQAGRSKDVESRVVNTFLREKWGVLDAQASIQPPTHRAMRAAWDLLERTFPEGCKEVRAEKAILRLLNPPYGHDYNTLTLTFTAWIGYNKDALQLYVGGKRFSLAEFQKWFEDAKNPEGFLSRCISSPLALSRAKPSEVLSQLEAMLSKDGEWTIADAREALATAERSLATLPETKREPIQKRCDELRVALEAAERYDGEVMKWQAALSAGNLEDVVKAREHLKRLPSYTWVRPDQPQVGELQQQWEQTVRARLPEFCRQHAALPDLGEYSAKVRALKAIHANLSDFREFREQIDAALNSLEQARDELQRRDQEREIVAKIEQVSDTDVLVKLYGSRDLLRSYTDLSAQTAQRRDQKLQAVEAAIQRIEQDARELQRDLGSLLDLGALAQAQRKLAALLPKVEGTPLHNALAETQHKHERIGEFLQSLDQLRGRAVNTPEDLEAVAQELRQLAATSPDWLSEAQRELLARAQQHLEDTRQQKEQEALDWLSALEQRVDGAANGAALSEVQRALEAPPPLLPLDQRTRLDQLKQRVQQRLDEDLVARIEVLFAQIADPERRRQCLERLHALMEAS